MQSKDFTIIRLTVLRAVFTVRGFGCDAYGYAAEDVNGRYSIKTTIREQFAKIAAVADVVLRRSPKFLGPREPLPPPACANPVKETQTERNAP